MSVHGDDQLAENAPIGRSELWGNLAWACVVAVAALAPIVSSNFTAFGLMAFPLTHDQIELPRAILLQVLGWGSLLLWGLSVSGRSIRVRVHWVLALLAAFLCVTLLSAVLSPFGFTAFFGAYRHYEGFLQYGCYAVIVFVAMQCVTPKRLVWLARLASATGLLLAVYGIEHALWADPVNWLSDIVGGRAFSTWGNPDFFGGYLLFPIAFSLAVCIADDEVGWRVVSAVSAVACSWALIATATRGAWLAGVCVVAMMIVLVARRGYAWISLAVAAATTLVTGVLGFNALSRGLVSSRSASAFAAHDTGLAARRVIWGYAWRLFASNPLRGSGPDTLVQAAQRFFGNSFANDAHNYLLQILATDGILGALTLVAFVVCGLLVASRGAWSRTPGGSQLALASAWAASIGYLVHLLAGISIITSTAMLCVCLGVLIGATTRQTRDLDLPWARLTALGATVALAASLVFGGIAVNADHSYLMARVAYRTGAPVATRVAWAKKAVQLSPYNESYAQELTSARAAATP